MNYTTHNEAIIEVDGTHGQGQLPCSYKTLVKAFGLPLDGDGYKVDAEWHVVFEDGTRATVYNWKNGKNYMGEKGLALDEIGFWNIGGFDKKAVEAVAHAIRNTYATI